MKGIEKIFAYIKSESDTQCGKIAKNATLECERIRVEYSQLEKDEYWKAINAGSKETESRLEQLNALAEVEANKQIQSTQQEMVTEAFSLATEKIRELPDNEYAELLIRLGFKAGTDAEDLVDSYRGKLSADVLSVLFD